MYLARYLHNGRLCYQIRRSLKTATGYTHESLVELGMDPTAFIVYPGGNSFYIDESIEEALDTLNVIRPEDALEDLFWPFVRPDIRDALQSFKNREKTNQRQSTLTEKEQERIRFGVHAFDKRRAHYLKIGNIDQGPVAAMPESLFRNLLGKSRDEIEQGFITQEARLDLSERKSYVYAILNLQQFFQGFMAKSMPQAMDQEKVDTFFLKELCHINDVLFETKEPPEGGGLHPYLVRYMIMFFDYDYAGTRLLDDFVNEFIYSHRFFREPALEKHLSIDKAGRIMGIDKAEFKTMTKRKLIKRYRVLAREHHPDTGGSQEKFIELTEAFQSLLKRKTNTSKTNR